MRFQQTPYSCGAAAIANALRCYGKKLSEARIRALAETTPDEGTDDQGICRALEELGFEGHVFDTPFSDQALEYVRDSVNHWSTGQPVILCTQNWQHWVTVIGAVDNSKRYIVVDPARTRRNAHENGVHVLSEKELLKTWQKRTGPMKYFGIIVTRKSRKKKR